jgi:hypothetical protein
MMNSTWGTAAAQRATPSNSLAPMLPPAPFVAVALSWNLSNP